MLKPLRTSNRLRLILATGIASLVTATSWAVIVTLRGSDAINTTSFNASLPAPGGWNNDAAPSAGNSYFTSNFQLRTPVPATGAATFAGDSLSIDAGGSLLFKETGVITINNLILNGGTLAQGATGGTPDLGTLAGVINLQAASTIDTTSANRNFLINSVIHGSVGLTIQGTTGTVTFAPLSGGVASVNDFTGPLTLKGSTALAVGTMTAGGVAGALGAATNAAGNIILDGGTLRINGLASFTDRLFTLTTNGGTLDASGTDGTNATAVNFTNTGAIAFTGTGARTFTLTGTSTANNTLAAVIGDNGGPTTLTKAGAGVWVLTATNTYSGPTNINGGFLTFSSFANLGTNTALNFGGGSLRWATGNTLDITTRTVTLTTGMSGFDTNGQNITLAGPISGGGGFTKFGGGVLTLPGSYTFAGNVSIGNNADAIRITNSNSLGIGAKTISILGNVGGGNTPHLFLNAAGANIELPGGMSFTTSDDTPTGTIVNEAGNNTIDGNFTVTSGGGGTRLIINAGSLTLNGAISLNQTPRTFSLQGAGNGIVNGIIRNDPVTLTNILSVNKDLAGTWVLNGANTYTGTTTVTAGTLVTNTASTGGGVVNVADGATFGVQVAAAGQTFNSSSLTVGTAAGGSLNLALGQSGNPTAPVVTAGTFTPNGTVNLSFTGGNLTPGQFTLIKYTTLGGGSVAALNLILPPRAQGTLVDDSANASVDLNLTAFDYPKWVGGTNDWDTTTQNWREVNSLNATAYIQGAGGSDAVLFDDTATNGNVNLTTALTPSSAVVNNSALAYAFSGTGKLSGAMTLTKQNNGTLILANTGGNDYTGPTIIASGTLQIGDGATVGGGQFGNGPVVNSGTLVFNRPDNFTVNNTISGAGSITQNGAGIVTLNSNNTFTGPVTVAAGTLRIGGPGSLGTVDSPTTVASGGTLDVNGQNVGAEIINIAGTGVGGNGALINTGATQINSLRFVTLTADASIGGTTRFDIRANGGGETLNLGGFTLTKVGTNDFHIVNTSITNGNIVVNGGLLSIEGTTLAQEAGTITYNAGTTAGFFQSVAADVTVPMIWNGNTFDSLGQTGAINSPITLGGNVTANTTANTFTLGGTITGGFGFTKTGAGTLILGGTAANSFNGTTTLSAGTLELLKTAGVAAIGGNVVLNGGTFLLGAANQFDPAASVTINNGGTWSNASNFAETMKNLTVNTATLQALNAISVTGTASFTAGQHDINSGQSFLANTLMISGGSNLRLGANTTPTSINILGGGLVLSDGTLQLGQLGGAGVAAQVNLSGDVTSSGTSLISAPNQLGPRTLDLQNGTRSFNVTGGTLTIGPAIQDGGLTKTGPGLLTLTGTEVYTGTTTVNAGTLVVSGSLSGTTNLAVNGGTFQMGATNAVSDLATVNLNGGTFATAGFSDTVGALTLGGAATLDFGNGASVLDFADSSANTWTGTLSITNWSGTPDIGLGTAGGGTDQLIFGNSGGALSPGELALVQFVNPDALPPGIYSAEILPNGEVVAIPEPATWSSLALAAVAFAGLGRFRRRHAHGEA